MSTAKKDTGSGPTLSPDTWIAPGNIRDKGDVSPSGNVEERSGEGRYGQGPIESTADKSAVLGRLERNGGLRVRDYRSVNPAGIVTLAVRAHTNTQQDPSRSALSRDGETVDASFLPSSTVQTTSENSNGQRRRLRIVGNIYGRNGIPPQDLHPSRMSLGQRYNRRPTRHLPNSRTVLMAAERLAAIHNLKRGLDYDARDRGRAASIRR